MLSQADGPVRAGPCHGPLAGPGWAPWSGRHTKWPWPQAPTEGASSQPCHQHTEQPRTMAERPGATSSGSRGWSRHDWPRSAEDYLRSGGTAVPTGTACLRRAPGPGRQACREPTL